MRRRASIGIALLALSHLAFANVSSALAQAGSIGGTIGKENKSVSGGEELQVPAPKRSGSKSLNSAIINQSEESKFGRGCGRIVGVWTWSNNVDVVVKRDGTADATDGGHAKLACDSGMYVFKWQSGGNMSRMTLASDGKRMSGTGFFGSESAVRK
jgi:hypothetical protein